MGGLKRFARSCEDCKRLGNPDNFVKGSRVKIFEALDCEHCEVRKYQPIAENEDIMELYDILPNNYDAFGIRMINVSDIKSMLELLDIPRELWDDIYQRLVFYHNEIIKAVSKVMKSKTKNRDDIEKWKRERLGNKRAH